MYSLAPEYEVILPAPVPATAVAVTDPVPVDAEAHVVSVIDQKSTSVAAEDSTK